MIITKGDESHPAYEEYMKRHFRTKEEILASIDRKIKKYTEQSTTDHKAPAAFYTIMDSILRSFRKEIEKAVLFDELPKWWIYDYELEYDRFTVSLDHVKEIDLNEDGGHEKGATHDAHYTLIALGFKTLSASEYAELYGVGDGTVRQWIRRGKLRTATKIGAEWRIPVLTMPPERGYEGAQYVWWKQMDDLPEEYQYLNDYKLATFFQDREDKTRFHVIFVSKKTKTCSDTSNNLELTLDAKEREKLELLMISRPEIRYSLSY